MNFAQYLLTPTTPLFKRTPEPDPDRLSSTGRKKRTISKETADNYRSVVGEIFRAKDFTEKLGYLPANSARACKLLLANDYIIVYDVLLVKGKKVNCYKWI